MSLYARIVGVALLAAAIVACWWKLTTHYESIGYERRKAEDAAAMRAQETSNRELQRAAELKYTVRGEVRERFITTTIKELRHETDNLAACVLSPAAALRLRNAAECASTDTAASCGADLPVR